MLTMYAVSMMSWSGCLCRKSLPLPREKMASDGSGAGRRPVSCPTSGSALAGKAPLCLLGHFSSGEAPLHFRCCPLKNLICPHPQGDERVSPYTSRLHLSEFDMFCPVTDWTTQELEGRGVQRGQGEGRTWASWRWDGVGGGQWEGRREVRVLAGGG